MAENLIVQSSIRDLVKQIVLYIHELDLQVGDRLLATPELREKLNCSDLALRRAMDYLVHEGLVRRKPKQGTIVEDLYAPLRNTWTVGVTTAASESEQAFAFDMCVANYLRSFLAREGYIDRTYPEVPQIPVGKDGTDMPEGFIGLSNDIRTGHVDAVITPRRLSCSDLPVFQAGAWELATQGVVIDFACFVEQSFQHLKKMGCKRIAYINIGDPTRNCRRGWDRFAQCVAADGQQVSPDNAYISTMMFEMSGQQIVRAILSTPARKRPDGIIIANDLLPLTLTQHLSQVPDYRPRIAVMTNRQITYHYALPVINFSIDCCELARQVVQMLAQHLRFPRKTRPQIVWFEPVLANDQ